MPAAAVTPAPIAYIKVVAVKKLVVGCMPRSGGVLGSENGSVRVIVFGCRVSKPDSINGRATSSERLALDVDGFRPGNIYLVAT